MAFVVVLGALQTLVLAAVVSVAYFFSPEGWDYFRHVGSPDQLKLLVLFGWPSLVGGIVCGLMDRSGIWIGALSGLLAGLLPAFMFVSPGESTPQVIGLVVWSAGSALGYGVVWTLFFLGDKARHRLLAFRR